MSHEVRWTKYIVETFIQEAMLSKEEEMVLRTRCAGKTILQQSELLSLSPSSISRIVRRLKQKYDAVAKDSPILPPRRKSVYEDFLDSN